MRYARWQKMGLELAIVAFAWWGWDWKVAALSFLWMWLMNLAALIQKEEAK